MLKQSEPLIKLNHISAILKLDQQQLLSPNNTKKNTLHENSFETSTANSSLNSSRTTMSSADNGSDDSSAALPIPTSKESTLTNEISKHSFKQKLKKTKSNESQRQTKLTTNNALPTYEQNPTINNYSMQPLSFYRWQINMDNLVRLFIIM